MFQEQAEIISNKIVSRGVYRMSIRTRRAAAKARPGQFVHIKVSDGKDPLLRRPISIHSLDERDVLSFLYAVKGRGTSLLAAMKAGGQVDFIGPLGNGFGIDKSIKRAVIVGGGIGVAPLLYLAQRCLAAGAGVTALLGARDADCLLCATDFKSLGCEVQLMTDDGSRGRKGYVTDLLEPALTTGSGKAGVFACGPVQMMRRAAVISAIYDIPCQVSLEENMACGVGACFGCAVDTKLGYKKVCADGPVFNASEVLWPE